MVERERERGREKERDRESPGPLVNNKGPSVPSQAKSGSEEGGERRRREKTRRGRRAHRKRVLAWNPWLALILKKKLAPH